MALQVNENNQVKHNGQVFKAGDVIQDIEKEAADELVKSGVVKDLDTIENAADNQAQSEPTPPANPEDQLERGQVENQLVDNVKKDLEDNEKLASTPGDPVVNNQAKPGLGAKLRNALGGNDNTPPANPTASDIAKDPQIQQQ